jgi:hypothetical protein
MADDTGQAWFILKEPGNYGVLAESPTCQATSTFNAQPSNLTNQGGYDHILSVNVECSPTGVSRKALSDDYQVRLAVHPNPFSTSVEILVTSTQYLVPSKNVQIAIYDISGKLVDRLSILGTRYKELGTGINWSPQTCPNGVYLVKVKIGNRILLKRITLLK